MQKDFFKNLSNELRNNHSGKKSYAPTFLNEAVIQKKQAQSAQSDAWEILESPKRHSKQQALSLLQERSQKHSW